jgi:hypothetical protein
MTAGDILPTVRAFTDEQIESDRRTIIDFLKRRSDDEKSPIRDAGAIDILSRYHPWEFRLFFLMDSPSIALRRIKQALSYIEGGVDDWFLTAAPEWAYVTETDYPEDGKQFVEHRGVTLALGPAEFSLLRRDEVHFDGTATEGVVLIEPCDIEAGAEATFTYADFIRDAEAFMPRSIAAARAADEKCRRLLAPQDAEAHADGSGS